LKHIGLIFPNLRHIFADRVYRGKQLPQALTEFGKWFIEIVTRSESIGALNLSPLGELERMGGDTAPTCPDWSERIIWDWI
jgi:hypothetical protein